MLWQCDKTLEEIQHHYEQQSLGKEITRAEDRDSDDDSASEQDVEEQLTSSQATQQDVSDEGIM